MRKFKELKIWQNGISIVKSVYKITKDFPKDEQFGLTSQIRRSAVSIPSNIAEGSAKSSDKDFNRFLEIALGSSFELETQLIIANEVEYLSMEKFEALNTELNQLQNSINSFVQKVKNF